MLANLPSPGPMQRPTALLAWLRRSPLQRGVGKPIPTLAALSADGARRLVAVDKAVPGLDTPNLLSGSELAFADVALHARVTDRQWLISKHFLSVTISHDERRLASPRGQVTAPNTTTMALVVSGGAVPIPTKWLSVPTSNNQGAHPAPR
jgi:hypothetical protein